MQRLNIRNERNLIRGDNSDQNKISVEYKVIATIQDENHQTVVTETYNTKIENDPAIKDFILGLVEKADFKQFDFILQDYVIDNYNG